MKFINIEKSISLFRTNSGYMACSNKDEGWVKVYDNVNRLISQLDIEQVFDIIVHSSFLICVGRKTAYTKFFALPQLNEVYDIQHSLFNVDMDNALNENLYLGYISNMEGLRLFDLENQKDKQCPHDAKNYFGFLNSDVFLICINDNSTLLCCDLQFKEHWSLDVNDIGFFEDELFGRRPGKVAAVEVWNDKLIVLTGKKVLWLEMETGQLLWELDTEQLNNWIILEDDIAYVNYLRINLQTRHIEESLYKNGGIPYIDTPTEKYTIRVEYFVKPTLHDDKLWAIANNSYGRYAVAIDKLTGEYLWHYLLDTDGNLTAPKFHSNKMYVWDDRQKLHVFEKGKKLSSSSEFPLGLRDVNRP